jgi:energy-coupling factor transporter ATP-binding protein EcfA2
MNNRVNFAENESRKMAVTIRAVHIENFRSIRNIDAKIGPLTVFAGRNDSGKSNILRSLNLFFNGETNPGIGFNFSEDYNFFASERSKKSREIVVRVELDIPESYRKTNGDLIVWEKRWRADGLIDSKYHGIRLSTNRRKRETREQILIPDKSNLHALLRKIEFEYVPAVKDTRYFDSLRGRIYSIISEVAAKTFRTSSSAFEDSIGEHLADLTASIGVALGFQTKLALPRDLSHIFERLDFLSGEKAVSLDNRGDGIKVRHIPLILKFMAEKKTSLQTRGGMPFSFIWAYEEPENNLEFGSAIQLADEMARYATSGTSQVLLTTHSPAFYDLASREEAALLHHVFRESDEEGSRTTLDTTAVDANLGTLAIISPRVAEITDRVRKQEFARLEAERLSKENKPKVFVEGESDAIVLRRSICLFFPEYANTIDFETKKNGAGHTYVIDMLRGWRSQHKHNPAGPKAAGIVDGDADNHKSEFNRIAENTKSVKCFSYHKPPHIIGALQNGFRVPVSLEVLYRPEVWTYAMENGHLESRKILDIYPSKVIEKIISGEMTAAVYSEHVWKIYVDNEFKFDSKISIATYLARKNDEEAKVEFAEFEALLKEVISYLGVSPSAPHASPPPSDQSSL